MNSRFLASGVLLVACSVEPESMPRENADSSAANADGEEAFIASQERSGTAGDSALSSETVDASPQVPPDWKSIIPDTDSWTFINAFDHYGLPLVGVVSEGEMRAIAQAQEDIEISGPIVDLRGRTLVPGFIDSHVHLSYFEGRDSLEKGGVLGAIDLAAPLVDLLPRPLTADFYLLSAGPMVTSIGGYPTQSWGRNGYGLEVADVAAAEAAVEDLITGGAGLIKVPVDGENGLGQELLERVVSLAHQNDRLVAAHALTAEGYNRARRAGVDGLAHTPTALMTKSEAKEWEGGFVLSTLYAFGASENAVNNIRNLSAAGVTILYGTDLGNRIISGIDTLELDLLREALNLSAAEAVELGTSQAADLWNLPIGRIEPGYDASFLLVDSSGVEALEILAEPEAVVQRGKIK